MPSSPSITLNKRAFTYLLLTIGAILLLTLTFTKHTSNTPVSYTSTPIHQITVPDFILKGDTTAVGKIENATTKAELGRAAWKLFHTTMAKFPDTPSPEEQTALFSYVHLFARLYPCGECAGHFRQILQKFPPQVSTRSTAAAWACHVHNEVNKSLNKELWDCSNIGDFYDCGCKDEEKGDEKKKQEKEQGTGKAEETEMIDLIVEKNGPTRGG